MSRSRHPLVALVLLFLALGVIYGLTTPLFEAPDEVWHVAYVRYIAQTGRLPVQGARQGEESTRQEASQPPLYYMLAAPLIAWLDTGDFDAVARLNPHAAPGQPHSDGNKNMVVHAAAPPWQGTALAVHILRLFSLLLGLVTILCAYDLGRHLFSDSPLHSCSLTAGNGSTSEWLALLLAALVAFNPQFLFITASVNNDNAMTALASIALVILARMVTDERAATRSYGRVGLLGVVTGLAAISKLTGVLLFGFVLIALLVIAWQRQTTEGSHRGLPLRWLVVSVGLIVLLTVAIAGWWYARNWLLYKDVTGLQPMLTWVGLRRLTLSQVIGELGGLELSFWAVFGWFNILADEWIYTALKIVARLALFGLGLWALQHLKRTYTHRQSAPTGTVVIGRPVVLGLAALWTAMVAAGLVRWTATTQGTQGRLLFPAIIAIAALLLTGLAAPVPRRLRLAAPAAFIAGLLALAAVVPWRYIAPTYARPPIVPTDRVQVAYPVHYRYGDDQIELLGYNLDRSRLQPGDALTVTLYYKALQHMTTDYSLFIHLWGQNMQWLGQRDSYPGRGNLPTSQMTPGDVIEDSYQVTIAPTATVPARVQLEVGFYDYDSGRRLPAMTPGGKKIELPFVGRFKLAAPQATAAAFADGGYILGGQLALVAWHIETPPAVQAGQVITVATSWQAWTALTTDYTIFLHLVDETGHIWTQNDSEPQGGEYPTGLWDVGEVVTDTRTLTMPTTLPPGHYGIVTGLYLLSSGERLPVYSPAGAIPENRAVIGQIDVP